MANYSVARRHEQAISHARNLAGRLARHKETIGVTVTRTLGAIEAAIGGGAAAATDFYMGVKTDAIPEAMIGPVPVVMTGAVFLTVTSILLQKEDWSTHVAGFAAGLGGAAAYAEGLRWLKLHESATAPASPT